MIFSVCFLALFNKTKSVGNAISAGVQLASNISFPLFLGGFESSLSSAFNTVITLPAHCS